MTTATWSDEDARRFFDGRRVLVTGAAGFYGQHIVARLSGYGAEVYGVSRSERSGSIRWIKADLSNLEDARAAVAASKPDVVFHLTSESQGARSLSIVPPSLMNDVVATVFTLTAVAELFPKARFVMTTSLEEPRTDPTRVDYEPIASSPYAAGKCAGALYGRMFHALYELPVVLLRPFFTYGFGQKEGKVIPYTILNLLRDEAPKLTSGSRPCDWIYVDDVVEAFVRASILPEAVGRTLDVGSGTLVPIRDIVEEIHELMGGPEPEFGTLSARRGLGGLQQEVRSADIAATTAALGGWLPVVSLSEGLQKTVDAFRERARTSGSG